MSAGCPRFPALARSLSSWSFLACDPPHRGDSGAFSQITVRAAPMVRVRAQPRAQAAWRKRLAQRPHRDAYTRDAAKRALQGASRRLARPQCQSLFSEFKDERQLPLTEKLRELETDPGRYLRLAVFQDGAQSSTCETRNTRVHRPMRPRHLSVRTRFRACLAPGPSVRPGGRHS